VLSVQYTVQTGLGTLLSFSRRFEIEMARVIENLKLFVFAAMPEKRTRTSIHISKRVFARKFSDDTGYRLPTHLTQARYGRLQNIREPHGWLRVRLLPVCAGRARAPAGVRGRLGWCRASALRAAPRRAREARPLKHARHVAGGGVRVQAPARSSALACRAAAAHSDHCPCDPARASTPHAHAACWREPPFSRRAAGWCSRCAPPEHGALLAGLLLASARAWPARTYAYMIGRIDAPY